MRGVWRAVGRGSRLGNVRGRGGAWTGRVRGLGRGRRRGRGTSQHGRLMLPRRRASPETRHVLAPEDLLGVKNIMGPTEESHLVDRGLPAERRCLDVIELELPRTTAAASVLA